MHIFKNTFTSWSVVVALICAGLPAVARADVALVIEEAVGGAGEFTGSGHSAVYLSNVCAETPVKLRVCKAGEEGVVVGAYPEWGDRAPYRWIAVPLTGFLYGVDRVEEAPVYANGKIRALLRNTYRHDHLQAIAPDLPGGSKPEGRWEQMLVSSFNRDVYFLNAKTTREQDLKVIDFLNGTPNVQTFSTTWNNCSDFARDVVNTYFPNATHRDFINDFSMTTPKALAKTFTWFADSKPERMFSVSKYDQVSGPIRRSIDIRHFTEKGLISRKYYLTMLTTKPEVYAAFALTYFATGGLYSLNRTYRKFPGQEMAELNLQRADVMNAKPALTELASLNAVLAEDDHRSPKERRKAIDAERVRVRTELFGTSEQWRAYKAQFAPMLSRAVEKKLFVDQKEVETFFKDLEIQSTPGFDERGLTMLEVDDHGTPRKLGVTRQNLMADYSDPVLAYKLMLVKVNYQLNAPGRNRASMPAFQQDWNLLLALQKKADEDIAASGERNYEARFRQTEEVVTGKKRFQKVMMEITH